MLSQQISWLFDPIITSTPPLAPPPFPSFPPPHPPSPAVCMTEAAVTAAAADAPGSSNGQVSENCSGAALRQSSSQPAPLPSGDFSNLRVVGHWESAVLTHSTPTPTPTPFLSPTNLNLNVCLVRLTNLLDTAPRPAKHDGCRWRSHGRDVWRTWPSSGCLPTWSQRPWMLRAGCHQHSWSPFWDPVKDSLSVPWNIARQP